MSSEFKCNLCKKGFERQIGENGRGFCVGTLKNPCKQDDMIRVCLIDLNLKEKRDSWLTVQAGEAFGMAIFLLMQAFKNRKAIRWSN